MRTALVTTVLLASATTGAVGGCGSSAGSSSRSDQQAVKTTTTSFLRFVAAGDGISACRLVTTGGRASLEAQFQKATNAKQHRGCDQIVAALARVLPTNVRNGLQTAQVKSVTVSGSKATVKNSDVTSASGSLTSFLPAGQTTRLLKVNGAWQIDS